MLRQCKYAAADPGIQFGVGGASYAVPHFLGGFGARAPSAPPLDPPVQAWRIKPSKCVVSMHPLLNGPPSATERVAEVHGANFARRCGCQVIVRHGAGAVKRIPSTLWLLVAVRFDWMQMLRV